MTKEKLTAEIRLWQKGKTHDRGYVVSKINETPQTCAYKMSLQEIKILKDGKSVKGRTKTGHIVVISYQDNDNYSVPYLVDITNEAYLEENYN